MRGRPDGREGPAAQDPAPFGGASPRGGGVRVLDEVFRSRTLEEWSEAFRDFSGVWAPVLTALEVHDHQQIEPNGFMPEITALDGSSSFRVVAPPQHFGDEPTIPAGPAPEVGQHTEEIMLEAGLNWDDISRLREEGAFG